MEAPWLNLNRAKFYLLLVVIALVVLIAWSAVELTRRNEGQSFSGTVLGLSIVSCALVAMVYYEASCTFAVQGTNV